MPIDKKEAKRLFKERVSVRGVFAIRCRPSGQFWVGNAGDLTAARTRAFFELRSGLHRNKALQAAWNEGGEQQFEFEVLEELDKDIDPLLLSDLIRARQKHWEQTLGGQPL